MKNDKSPSIMQKQFANYEQKRKTCFLYVARELTGRAKQRLLISEKKTLDWEKFNTYFNKYYEQYTSDEMLIEILDNSWWLTSEQEVLNLYWRYLEDAQQQKNNGRKQISTDDDELDFSLSK